MATEARDRIAARVRGAAQRRTVAAPSTLRDDSGDEMIVSIPEFGFKEFIAMVAMTVFLVLVSLFIRRRCWARRTRASRRTHRRHPGTSSACRNCSLGFRR